MNRLSGLSVLAVALAAAATLTAQDAGSVEQRSATAGKEASQTEVSQAPATTDRPPATTDTVIQTAPVTIEPAEPEKLITDPPVTKLPGDTHVRIVRLSQVQGKVGMDRGSGHGVEQAMQNMPIVEGMLLGTASEGYAEVEFEDGSTMRLGPGSAVKFSQLVTRATGAKSSMVRVDRGTVYVSRENTKADEFTLAALGLRKMEVQPATHLRLELEGTKAELAVFSGYVSVTGSAESKMVAKKQTLLVDVADKSGVGELTKKVDEAAYDGWDKDLQKYHDQYAKGNSLLGGGSGFGVSDLNYYGSFITAGGCGTFWQPYFASASWNPYGAGVWAQYGSGYSWVSPYPWGWLPYHSGGWAYCPSYGWGWQPGGSFVGLNNIAGVGVPIRNGLGHIPGGGLPRPPAEARASMVVVNNQSLVTSKAESGGNFRFQRDSAGFGVPRGSLGKLNGISNDVAKNGFANREVYAAPAGSSSHWNDGQVYHGPLTMHKGSMPDEARQAMWARQQAAANGSLGSPANRHEGQLGAGPGRGAQASGQNGAPAGWQGRQGQSGQLNNNGNNLGWKGGQQGGANANANANGSHSWNNAGAGGGAGVGAGGGSGHSWNNAGGGNAGGASAGGGHTWSGGNGGGGSLNGGGGGRWGGGGGGNSAGAGGGGGHSGGGGNGGGNAGGGGNSGGGSSGSMSSGGGSHK